jgi:threonine dehydrogenase-like Zn-dependent dehydrogenase/enoyl-CoA hydratase/carnithine racemase
MGNFSVNRLGKAMPQVTPKFSQMGVQSWKRMDIGGRIFYQGVNEKGNIMPDFIYGSGFPEVQYKNILTVVLPPREIEGLTGEALLITLNRPKAANFLNSETMEEINKALDGITDETQVVIFSGEGRNFCAGVSIEEHLPPHYENTIKAFTALIDRIRGIPAKTVGLIQGNVMGGGAELITVLDHVIASEDVRIGFPETTLNVIPYIALVTLPRIVDDPKWALDAILDGRFSFSAQGALERGLVDEVTSEELTPLLASKYLAAQPSRRNLLSNNIDTDLKELEEYGKKIIERVIASNPKISRDVLDLTLHSLLELSWMRDYSAASAFLRAQEIYLTSLMENLKQPAIQGLEGFIGKQKHASAVSKAFIVGKIEESLPFDQERIGAVNARIAEIQRSPRRETEIGKMWAVMFNPRTLELELKQAPIPKLKPGEALVKITACGGCGTDHHYIGGHARPIIQDRELILGHEASGKIVLLGSAVQDPNLLNGNVLIPAVLRDGRMVGSDINGAWAEFMAFPADQLVMLPDNFPVVKGSVIADAITTPYHAVKSRAKLMEGEVAAVIGVGGVGVNVIQVVKALGGIPVAIDINGNKLVLAGQLGAALTINTSGLRGDEFKSIEKARAISAAIKKALGKPAAVVFEVIGSPVTTQLAWDLSLQAGRGKGRAVIIGFGVGKIDSRTEDIMYNEAEMLGSYGCPIEEYAGAVDLVARDKINLDGIVTHAYPLSEYRNWVLDMSNDPQISRGIFVMPEAYPTWWQNYVDSE